MPRTEVRLGISRAYEALGEGEPRVPIIEIGTQPLSWPDDFVARLAPQGHRVILFDNRGCGESTSLMNRSAPAPMRAPMFHGRSHTCRSGTRGEERRWRRQPQTAEATMSRARWARP